MGALTLLALFIGVVMMVVTVETVDVIAPAKYRSNAEMESFLRTTQHNYRNITHLYSIGKSLLGKELWVLAIGETPDKHVTLRPEVKYVGNMHGNEVLGREMLLNFVEYLVKNYGQNDTVTAFLDNTRVHILVSLNPDGFGLAFPDPEEDICMGVFGRYNNNSADLNRNFPDYFVDNAVEREPETLAVMKWIREQQFVLSANLHGGSMVANYPFDSYTKSNIIKRARYVPSPDEDVFVHLAKAYSLSHRRMYKGEPCREGSSSFTDGITNGAMWYPMTGGMQDYNYNFAGCMEVTLEISCCKWPEAADLPELWLDNKDALFNYIRQVHRGVKGIVRDVVTEEPVAKARVVVVNRESIVMNTTAEGEYWRLLLPGNYQLQVSAEKYETKTVKVTVPEEELYTVVNVDLVYGPVGRAATWLPHVTTYLALTVVPLLLRVCH